MELHFETDTGKQGDRFEFLEVKCPEPGHWVVLSGEGIKVQYN